MKVKTKVKIPLYLYVFLSIVYFELLVRLKTVDIFFGIGLLYSLLFAVVAAAVLYFFSSFARSERVNRIVTGLLLLITGVYFGLQLVYHGIFATFFTVSSFGGAGQATEFFHEAMLGILRNFDSVLLVFVPSLLVFIFGKRFVDFSRAGIKLHIAAVGVALIFHFGTDAIIKADNSGVIPTSYYYEYTYVPEIMIEKFGTLATLRFDLTYQFAEVKTQPVDPDGMVAISKEDEPKYNVIPGLDFASLAESESDPDVKNMHEYFGSLTPTEKNEYTGMFAGKNLIQIVCESFSGAIVLQNPELFPTLYKLYSEGFQFNNFYTPLWAVSTTDGEYATDVGLVPKSKGWSMEKSSGNSLIFCLGNQFKGLGYDTMAFHNGSYNYYNRQITHPNMGYTEYKGIGNGLEIPYARPYSDLEMIKAAWPSIAESKAFSAYFMTISGHLYYDFSNNDMAIKNRAAVEQLPYSDTTKAYIAANLELENAVTYLIEQLGASGQLENTVIALSADHYPYGLTGGQLEEITGGSVADSELYRNMFIVWSSDMASPVTVDKPCSSLDILPTLLNLFGMEYDSRLLSGSDILSSSPGLVIFKDYSFLTDKGYFDSSTGIFTPADGQQVDSDYARQTAETVCQKFTYAGYILDYNYYSHIK